MKKVAAATGAWVGGLVGTVLLAFLYLGHQLFRLPFVPFDFWNWQARVVPRNLLSLAVSGVGYILAQVLGTNPDTWGKTSEQIGALVFFVAFLALFGLGIAWLKRRVDATARLIGTGMGILALALVLAMEFVLGIRAPLAGSLLWLSVLFSAWGFSVGAILDGEVMASLPATVDEERRQGLLKLAGGAVAAALAAWGLGSLLGNGQRASEADQPLAVGTSQPFPVTSATREPTATVEAQAEATPAPTESDAVAEAAEIPVGDDGRIIPAPGTREEVTPRGEFYRVDINASPIEIDGSAWRLVMAGLFESTPRLTMSDLRSYPVHTQAITLSCISNPIAGSAIGTAYWTGLRLRDLVEDLGVLPEARFLFIQSADGFYETVPIEDVVNPQTLLVYGMNDRTLPVKHGFPLRIYIPNRYGMKQPKWIERIEAAEDDQGGYWTDRGWSKQAIANTTSVIDTVATEAAEDGHVPVGGIAWAGARSIQKVELTVDDGPWTEVTLRTPPLSSLTWVQWRHQWLASDGEHTFTVRAVDGEGNLQTSEERGILPSGATGYHDVDVDI